MYSFGSDPSSSHITTIRAWATDAFLSFRRSFQLPLSAKAVCGRFQRFDSLKAETHPPANEDVTIRFFLSQPAQLEKLEFQAKQEVLFF